MNLKRINLLLGLIILTSLLYSCHQTSSSSNSESSFISEVESSSSSQQVLKDNKVNIYSAPSGVELYEEVELFAADKKVDLYQVKVNDSQVWNGLAPNRINSAVAIIQLEGKVTLKVKTLYELNYETKVRPLSYNIKPFTNISEKTFSFEIFNIGSYVIEPNGDRTKAIHLFVNAIDETNYNLDDSNVIYFGPGLHTSSNNSKIINNTVTINSNQTVIVDYGAVVRARFVSSNASNIAIIGGGVIDGSSFVRIAGQTSGNTQFVPFDFNYCKNVSLRDFTVLDPAGWCINAYFMEDGLIDNIKIITSRSNGDGISIQSGKNIEIKNSFVRSWDDSIVVKNYPKWHDRTQHGTTLNISFTNMILWTDLAQSMEIGYETVGEVMENISFSNITVLHNYHKPVISIHNGNNAEIKDVIFKDITVEDASMGQGDARSNLQLIDLNIAYSANWSSQHTTTSLGSIEDVLVENIKVISGNNNIPLKIMGCVDTRSGYNNSIHVVSNVILKNIDIKGVKVTTNYPYLQLNDYVSNLNIINDGSTVTGATIIRKWSKEELKSFGSNVIIMKDGSII